MSAHRQHYLQANAPLTRRQESRAHLYVGNLLAVAILVVVIFGTVVSRYWPGPAVQVTPVRSPVITSVEQARIEGFRAGVAAQREAGCAGPTLTSPVAAE